MGPGVTDIACHPRSRRCVGAREARWRSACVNALLLGALLLPGVCGVYVRWEVGEKKAEDVRRARNARTMRALDLSGLQKALPWNLWRSSIGLHGTFTLAEQAELEAGLARANRFLEYGSGFSTVAAAARRPPLPFVSVDSAIAWRDNVAASVGQHAAGVLLFVDIGASPGDSYWGYPPMTTSFIDQWAAYVNADGRVEDLAPDLVLVDGRFRVACALRVLPTLLATNGTLLMHDYPTRPYYHFVEAYYTLVKVVDRLAVLRPKPLLSDDKLSADLRAFAAVIY